MTMPVFDGHNDTLLRLWMAADHAGTGFIRGMNDRHIDADKARRGGLIGGFFAIFTPQQNQSGGAIIGTDPIGMTDATSATNAMMDCLDAMAANHPDVIRKITSADGILKAKDDGVIAALLHIEGAEAIAPDLSNLDDYYARGLRSIGPVWSRQNAFGTGVPFGHPATPNQGGGLTPLGVALVKAAAQKNILIDVSHLNEAGFWDIAKLAVMPLVATHSNVHALSPSPRNLTDMQLSAIAESGGLVGLNFAAAFLREDGGRVADTPISLMLRHLDRLVETLGEDGVAFGSDFDGAIIPDAIGDAAGLPVLIAAMESADYGAELIAKISHQNWITMIRKIIG